METVLSALLLLTRAAKSSAAKSSASKTRSMESRLYTDTRCRLRCSTVFYLGIVNIFAGVMIMTIIYSLKETQQMARKLIIVYLKHEHHATIFNHIVNTQSVKQV